MSFQRWQQFNKYQQNGNISSEIARAIQSLENSKSEEAYLAILRVIDMLQYQRMVVKNREIGIISELIGESTIKPDLDFLKYAYDYFLLMAIPKN